MGRSILTHCRPLASSISGHFWLQVVSKGHFWPLTLLLFQSSIVLASIYFSHLLLLCVLLLQLILFFILLNFAATSKFLKIFLIPLPRPTICHGSRSEERWLALIHRNPCVYPFRAKISKVMLRSGNRKTRNCIFSCPVLSPLTKLDCFLIFFHVCYLLKCKPSVTERSSSYPYLLASPLQNVLIYYPSSLLDLFLPSVWGKYWDCFVEGSSMENAAYNLWLQLRKTSMVWGQWDELNSWFFFSPLLAHLCMSLKLLGPHFSYL